MITSRKTREANAEAGATGRQAPSGAECGQPGRTCAVGGRARGPSPGAASRQRPRGPARFPGPVHSFCTRDRRRREPGLRGGADGPGHNPRSGAQATPRFPPADEESLPRPAAGPAPALEPAAPPSPGTGRASPPRPRPHGPRAPGVRRSAAAGSLPGAPSSAPDFLAAEARPFSAMPRTSRRLPRQADGRAARRAG